MGASLDRKAREGCAIHCQELSAKKVNDPGSEDQLPPQVRQAKSRVSGINLKLPDEGIDLEEIEKKILVPRPSS